MSSQELLEIIKVEDVEIINSYLRNIDEKKLTDELSNLNSTSLEILGESIENALERRRNRCINCGLNLGEMNPRQLCEKWHCPNSKNEFYKVTDTDSDDSDEEDDIFFRPGEWFALYVLKEYNSEQMCPELLDEKFDIFKKMSMDGQKFYREKYFNEFNQLLSKKNWDKNFLLRKGYYEWCRQDFVKNDYKVLSNYDNLSRIWKILKFDISGLKFNDSKFNNLVKEDHLLLLDKNYVVDNNIFAKFEKIEYNLSLPLSFSYLFGDEILKNIPKNPLMNIYAKIDKYNSEVILDLVNNCIVWKCLDNRFTKNINTCTLKFSGNIIREDRELINENSAKKRKL